MRSSGGRELTLPYAGLVGRDPALVRGVLFRGGGRFPGEVPQVGYRRVSSRAPFSRWALSQLATNQRTYTFRIHASEVVHSL